MNLFLEGSRKKWARTSHQLEISADTFHIVASTLVRSIPMAAEKMTRTCPAAAKVTMTPEIGFTVSLTLPRSVQPDSVALGYNQKINQHQP